MKTVARFLVPLGLLALVLACLPGGKVAPTATPAVSQTETLPPATATLPESTATASPIPPTEAPTEGVSLPAGWEWFSSELCRYRIGYPPGSSVSDDDVTGCYVRIDLPVVEGTNLGEKYLAIYASFGGGECKSPFGAGYAPRETSTGMQEIGGDLFLVEAGADAGAGNYYDWTSYSTSQGDTCASLSFMLHSTNALFYDPPIPEFDRDAESAIFIQMVETFEWLAP
ncbi:MAG: hypothetical protein HPY76_09815 [Anaerolineae bacterium]|nr:hypothetical protein [Anaerolineae bacterium]